MSLDLPIGWIVSGLLALAFAVHVAWTARRDAVKPKSPKKTKEPGHELHEAPPQGRDYHEEIERDLAAMDEEHDVRDDPGDVVYMREYLDSSRRDAARDE